LIEADKIYHTNLAKTLGQNIQGIKDSHIFKDAPELIDVLDEVLKERNYVIHQLFKDDVRKQCIQNNLQQVLDRLGDDVDRLNNLNEKLLEIIIDLDQKLSNSVK
jgi:predicted nuclease with TOPRIM domain